jgi:hypothetical protein
VIGHLGARVSALLDGQLSPDETERAWEHVHACHACRDLVEREGWVKRRLAGLSFDVAAPPAPSGLKGALLGGPPGDAYLEHHPDDPHDPRDTASGGQRRRAIGLAAIGGSAAGAAVMGVLAFGVAPADAPGPRAPERRLPSTSISGSVSGSTQTPVVAPTSRASSHAGHARRSVR